MSNSGRVRNILLVIEYEGTGLAGWQRQADRPTVQGHLEAALARLTDAPVTVYGAGRTDAGVHARGQAANFKTGSRRTLTEIVRGTNALLPARIAVRSASEVALDFHARYDAKSKIYDYELMVSPTRSVWRRHFAWHLEGPLDTEVMRLCLDCLVGEHDFASFQSTGSEVKSSVRRILKTDIETTPEGFIRISLEGNGFLRHMVRAVVGTLVLAGRGKIGPEDFQEILAAADRSRAGATAPAHGLFLRAVRY